MSRVVNGDKFLPNSASEEDESTPTKKRLDHILVNIYKSYNRSTLQKFIKEGFVKVDGVTVTKANAKFPESVKIDLHIPDNLKHADVKPKIIYEDANVIVVDKPTGLLSEAKGEYCPERTLADFGYVVHRLDRDTSGVMILAKTEEVQQYLKRQFQARKVHKTYRAVIKGQPKLNLAKIELPLLRDKRRPTTFRVDPAGKASETYYQLLKTNGDYSLVELKPVTGRTHQLRVHMQYLGHPIVGDPVYGDGAANRLYLHACELEITLPGGKRTTFRSKMPESFNRYVS